MKKLVLVFACALTLAAAAVETSIAYQGVLKDATGQTAITGARVITFRLYSDASGGTPLWGRSVSVQLDSAGLFNVELADGNGSVVAGAKHATLADALKAARGVSLFIGLEVNESSGEIQPRQKILMTPYSSWASDVTRASGDFSVAGRATLGSAEVTGGLVVEGDASFSEKVSFANGISVAGSISVKNQGAIDGYGTIPKGGIIMWSGSVVPDGWALCNGGTSNGMRTPDLRDRFVLGGELNASGATGGGSTVTLSVDNLPPHDHMYAGDDQLVLIRQGNGYKPADHVVTTSGGYDATSTDSGSARIYSTSKTGGGKAISIMPPFYKLAFIMRVK